MVTVRTRTQGRYRGQVYPMHGGLTSTPRTTAAETFRIREDARIASAKARLVSNPNQAVWITMGRGFGRRTGWLTPYGFYPSNSYMGRRPVPGHGSVKVAEPTKYLDLKTGNIYDETRSRPTQPIFIQSYAEADRMNITPRDEIIGTIYDPNSDKVLAFWRGHTFSHVGRNMPPGGWGKFFVRELGTGDFIGEISANTSLNAHNLALKRYTQTPIDVVEVP